MKIQKINTRSFKSRTSSDFLKFVSNNCAKNQVIALDSWVIAVTDRQDWQASHIKVGPSWSNKNYEAKEIEYKCYRCPICPLHVRAVETRAITWWAWTKRGQKTFWKIVKWTFSKTNKHNKLKYTMHPGRYL